ncbi:uncharacterized protein N0V89_004134 [Didymosphaeria variabile]|uniref:Transcription factor domain-containing protein n=1 Tax=Didymosphaeria variabile TaxID=1932322 RepID=A0A9W8XR96_9PLEO|nr:uncharacterized protein N0V89_004134 [Didymosphaeria variabile]KAJ4356106.1 hypothetical protein N0V89_004134 [Didymosphaeria variabile]
MDPTASDSVLDSDQMTNENGTTNVLDPVPALVDWFDPILGINDSLQWSDLFSLDFDTGNSLLMPQYAAHYPEHEFGMTQPDSGIALSEETLRAQDPAPLDYPLSSASAQTFNEPHPQGAAVGIIEQHRIFLAEVDSPTEAQFLLKHFYDFIIPGWSFMPSNAKSPWTIFQLSEAARSLSEMTFLQTGLLKHANAANLYGILACSAYHLSVSSGQTTKEPEYWMGLFIRLRSQANVHMQVSLREELKGPAKAKYKDQLMAILAMLACAVSYLLQ